MISSAMLGQYLSKRLIKRAEELKRIKIMLVVLSAELDYCQAPVDALIEKLCERNELSKLSLLTKCRDDMKSGEQFPIAWKQAVEREASSGFLNPSDTDILYSLGETLGTTGVAGQLSNIKMHEELLSENLKTAIENAQKYSKTVVAICFLTGLVLAIVLY